MSFTARQVEEAIESDPDFEGWTSVKYHDGPEYIVIDGVGVRLEYVDSYGGEGLGEEAWFVIKLGEKYFRMEGYYLSHDGYTWDGDLEEVKPVKKTVTVYE